MLMLARALRWPPLLCQLLWCYSFVIRSWLHCPLEKTALAFHFVICF